MGRMGTRSGAAHVGAAILHSTASYQESPELLRSVFDQGVFVWLKDEDFLAEATIVQRDAFVGANSMIRPGQTEQYYATRDGMFYLLTVGTQGPRAWWLRRHRHIARDAEWAGYAADVIFAGEHLNGFVLRSGLYEDVGGGELKVAGHLRRAHAVTVAVAVKVTAHGQQEQEHQQQQQQEQEQQQQLALG